MRHCLGVLYPILFKNAFITQPWCMPEMRWDGKPCMNNCSRYSMTNCNAGIVERSCGSWNLVLILCRLFFPSMVTFRVRMTFDVINVNWLGDDDSIVYHIVTKACFLEQIFLVTKYMYLDIWWIIYIVQEPTVTLLIGY